MKKWKVTRNDGMSVRSRTFWSSQGNPWFDMNNNKPPDSVFVNDGDVMKLELLLESHPENTEEAEAV